MIRRLTKRQFVRNVAILSSGQAIAQGLAIAASPILTRLFDPDAFGTFGLLLAISSAFVVVSGLRYEMAVVTAKDDASAANLLVLSCGLVLLVSGLSAALPGLAGDLIADLVDRPGFGPVLWWLPVVIFAGGTYQALGFWTTRRKHYTRLAASRVVRTIGAVSAQVAAGFAAIGSAGLIGGRTLGSLMGTGVLSIRIWRNDRSLIRSSITPSRLLEVARENSKFPKYNAPYNLINTVSKALVPFTLAPFFGVEIVGFYYLAERVMRTPTVLIAGSVKRVYFQRASELYNKNKSFHVLLLSTIAGLFCLGVVPFLLLVFYGPELFSIVFGSEWRKAGVLVQWLVGWWFLAYLSAPAAATLIILNLQQYLLYYQIAISLARFSSILIAAIVGDEITAIAACSVVGAIFNFCLMTFALTIAVRHSKTRSSSRVSMPQPAPPE